MRPENPHLPSAHQVGAQQPTEHTRQWREECGPHYHQACLELAQWFWLEGKPAQSILQLNKSFMADLSDFPEESVSPYDALVWILQHRTADDFVGNPVRHFQHLATRMSGVRSVLRTWRAWACYHLAKKILSPEEFPPDQRQIDSEQLQIPDSKEVSRRLQEHGVGKEADLWKALYLSL